MRTRGKRRSRAARRPGRARPAGSKRTWALALWASGLGALAGIGVWWGAQRIVAHPALGIREVVLVGDRTLGQEELRRLAGIRPGEAWLALDSAAVRFRLRSHPWVQDARVRRPWLGKVRIEVEECVPLARVRVQGREYGICEDLRILPGRVDPEGRLPVLRSEMTDGALSRGVEYLLALRGSGLPPQETVELEIGAGSDRISLPGRGISVSVDEAIAPGRAVENFAAFLETLDGEGASRGTLRLISDGTAVWKAV